MAINQLNARRTAFIHHEMVDAATTNIATGVAIPAGALVVGIRMVSPDAVTTTNGSASVQLLAGTEPLALTWKALSFPDIGVIATTATLTAAGVLMASGGELKILQQASSSTAVTGSWDIYVDYLFVSDHESA